MSGQGSLLPMSAGEDLRLLRRSRGITLRDAAGRLKCPERVLRAIEEDRDPGIAAVYLNGFLRRYGELLELDEDAIQALLAAHEREAPPVQTVFETRAPTQASERWLKVASYVMASLLVGTLAWQVTHEAVRLTTQAEQPRVESEPPQEPAPASAASHVNASIAALENLHSPSGSRTADAGVAAWKALEDVRRQREARALGAYELVLETSADTWVEIHGAGDLLLEQDLLRGGERRSYRDDGPFRISLGRASAVTLSVDGRPVDLAPYTRENVARLRLDPAVLAGQGAAEPAKGEAGP